MILKVARLGHPAVRTPAQPVPADQIKTHDFQKLLDDMVETLHEYIGVGLAGPQVHLPLQVAVLEVEQHPGWPTPAEAEGYFRSLLEEDRKKWGAD